MSINKGPVAKFTAEYSKAHHALDAYGAPLADINGKAYTLSERIIVLMREIKEGKTKASAACLTAATPKRRSRFGTDSSYHKNP